MRGDGLNESPALFSNARYRLFFCSSGISNLGDGIALLALPWLASLISRDAQMIAWVTAGLRLPWLFFSLPAGVAADRWDRRQLMLTADSLRFVILVLLALALTMGPDLSTLTTAQQPLMMLALTAIAFALGSAEVLRDNTAQTLLPSVVEADQLERANGHMWSAEQLLGQFVGPPLAGALMVYSLAASFQVYALCVALAFVCLYQLRLPAVRSSSCDSAWQQAKEGLQWLYGHEVLLRLGLMLGVLNFISAGAVTVLVLYSQDVLGLSATQHGLLLLSGAVGGVLGGLVGPAIVARLGGQRTLHLALILFAAPFALIALSSQVAWVALALFVELFAAVLWNLVTVSLRQRIIPSQLLGRVNSVYRLLGWGVMPLGALAAGYLVSAAEHYMPREDALRLPYAVAAVLALLLFGYGLARLRLREQ